MAGAPETNPAVKWLLVLLVLGMVVLHQDFWQWTDKRLVFGFLPVGLAYHAAYSIAAAILMALVVHFAWPHRLEADLEASAGGSERSA